MIDEVKHICVCICTFKRPLLLSRLLNQLEEQKTDGLFTYSVVVADNDSFQSARHTVLEFAGLSGLNTKYCVESRQNIALARNKALDNAYGDYIAFIDDDEYPAIDWLYNLFKICEGYSVAGVLGPVKPCFEQVPPKWVTRGKFFERPTHETGHRIDLSEARTGNVLLRRSILSGVDAPFRSEFGTGGEDVDFFRRMIEKGCVFIWCNEAVVHETVSLTRCNRRYLLRRALLRGGNSLKQREGRIKKLIKSLIALPFYGFALPCLYIAGDHHFMKYMIKFCDHAGRILSLYGLNPIRERDI